MPAPFQRVVTARVDDEPDGRLRTTARVDDFFHGFEVALDVRDGEVVGGQATAHRHPWTTCPGAIAFVANLRGPVAEAGERAFATPRRETCVHVNDLVWLAARCHRDRRYEAVVTPARAELRRDGDVVLTWPMEGWRIVGAGLFAGLRISDPRWAATLDAVGADDDLREAVRVLRRAVHVGMGYWELDWEPVRVAADLASDFMRDTCYTFTTERLELGRKLAPTPPI